MKRITGRLAEDKGKYYAVINLPNTDGKRKTKWHTLNLEAKKGNKKEAQHRLNQILDKYNAGDLYLAETMTHAEQERNRLANMDLIDYLEEWLEGHQYNIERQTYLQYKRYIDGHIREFFTPLDLAVKELTGDEINDFYTCLRNKGLKGSTCQRYHSLLHVAFKDAVKRRVIPANPVDQANRPKKEQYISGFYNAEEVKQLLELTRDDEIYIPILLAAYYGLRRSEVVGVKWSAIDFTENTLTIRHTVHSTEEGLVTKDRLKTKSSYRTLTLEPFVREELLKHREEQERMKKTMRSAYSKEYTDYVCVDALGRLYDPDFISNRFGQLLEKLKLKKIRFHDLRHSCASVLLAQGVPMKQIQEWLGHSDMSTTANIYSHLDAVSKADTGAAMSKALG
ncbi:MAG: site-specific integrase [Clostridia bacterium]|nr:site-specific integrase [Clostridia bacterium]